MLRLFGCRLLFALLEAQTRGPFFGRPSDLATRRGRCLFERLPKSHKRINSPSLHAHGRSPLLAFLGRYLHMAVGSYQRPICGLLRGHDLRLRKLHSQMQLLRCWLLSLELHAHGTAVVLCQAPGTCCRARTNSSTESVLSTGQADTAASECRRPAQSRWVTFAFSSSGRTSSSLPVIQMTTGSCL